MHLNFHRLNRMCPLVATAALFVAASVNVMGQPGPGDRPQRPRPAGETPPAEAKAPVTAESGLKQRTEKAHPGWTLMAPIGSTNTWLLDLDGKAVHEWPSDYPPGNAVYLMDDGSLLRTCRTRSGGGFEAGGRGGLLQRIDWDGKVTWEYRLPDGLMMHHDVEPLPNGNILAIAWRRYSPEEAAAAGYEIREMPQQRGGRQRGPGRRDETPGERWVDGVYEIKPVGANGGEIVWQWNAWDHLVQDTDETKPNYGKPSDHPERINVNWSRRGQADWMHTNAIDYNPELDQVALSVHGFDEIWIIDHGTTTEEAKGAKGDLLYRWGNPQAWGAGSASDQVLFRQHDVRWIEPGHPGAGDLMIFNNGDPRKGSTIVQITTPIKEDGAYGRKDGVAFGPRSLTWEFQGSGASAFNSHNISGAERLPNGNTLICSGAEGKLLEVTSDGDVAWAYINPFISKRGGGGGPPPNGEGMPDRPRRGDRGMDRPGGPPGDDGQRRGRGRRGRRGPAEGAPEGGPGRGAPGTGNEVFRVERIGQDHPVAVMIQSKSKPSSPADDSKPAAGEERKQ
ncbi:MAG: aryl-sulfate sulfotransferase [Phycisphaerales bacterium]|nr:aryl-sulfate sulfotransferase [Phycisphaerales bacterium]